MCPHGQAVIFPDEELFNKESWDFAKQLEAKLKLALEDLHLSNGTAELAMKHRDEAQAVLEKIRSLVTTDHETKADFISRVKNCLPPDPFEGL